MKGPIVSQRRTLILIAAISVGAIAAFLVWNYVNGIDQRASNNAVQVPVYLVKVQIARGTYGSEVNNKNAIKQEKIPRKFLPPNAITSPDEISQKVAVNNLVPNQIVVSDMFASPDVAQASFGDRLEKIHKADQTAITISTDKIRGVAGLLQPGDYVNIMLTQVVQLDDKGKPVGVPTGASKDEVLFAQQARYLYEKVKILAVGQTPVLQPGETAKAASADGADATAAPANGQDSGFITFIVPAEAAQYIASVAPESIYLTLVARDFKPVQTGPIDLKAPLPAEDPGQLTPYGSAGDKK